MVTTKYYNAIEAAEKREQEERAAGKTRLPDFDLAAQATGGWRAWLGQAFLDNSTWWLGLLRAVMPRPYFGKLLIVTRYDDVREVLERQDVFEVPFGREMKTLAGGENFVLGMQDGDRYRQLHRCLETAFADAFNPATADDAIGAHVATMSAAFVENCGGTIDAIRDLVVPTGTNVVRRFYGVDVLDDVAFAHWSISCSMLLFADPQGSPETRAMARAGAVRLRAAIDTAIAAARRGEKPPSTIVRRLVDMCHPDGTPAADDAVIRGLLFGMITGFVPTNVLAAANLLEVLFKRPDIFRAAREAARADDDRRLERILFEALRFRSPLNPGVLRYANQDYVLGEKRGAPLRVAEGTTLMVSTQSAMFDRRQFPDAARFDPDRPAARKMLFGHGIHWCIGAEIARVHITQALKPLLKTLNLRPTGKVLRVGPFTLERPLRFDADSAHATQSFVTSLIPLVGVADAEQRRALVEIEKLGNPARDDLRKAIDDTGCVHFMSINVLPSVDTMEDQPDAAGNPESETGFLIVEMSVDGDPARAVSKFVQHAGRLVMPVFRCCEVVDQASLERLLLANMRPLSWNGRGAYGLPFCGTPELSVQRIRREAHLDELARRSIESFMARATRAGDGQRVNPAAHALETLEYVRNDLRRQGQYWCFLPQRVAFERDPVPLTRTSLLSIVPTSFYWAAGSAVALLALLLYWGALASSPGKPTLTGALRELSKLALSAASAALIAAAGLALIGLYLYRKLVRMETSDRARDVEHGAEVGKDILSRENAAGYVQNHMFAVSRLKPGRFRALLLRFVYRGIEALAGHFRPGHLADIGTIHFARWVKLPATNRLLFFSNYDGSWESYLEDFITKARQGLTGVWSNTKDFPRTELLINKGATDGARFKRWARRQQRPTQFWYSAYPDLTANRIRTNAFVRAGIANARSESAAKAWIERFGTLPQPETAIEYDQIQSLLFTGFGSLEHSTCLLMAFEGATDKCRDWVASIADHLSYGDEPSGLSARILAFSESGLAHLGLGKAPKDPDVASESIGLATFPPAFTMGMADPARARLLGDDGNLRWGRRDEIDLALLLYADTPQRLRDEIEFWTTGFPGDIVRAIRTGLDRKPDVPGRETTAIHRSPRDDATYEPFGFADGLSQPVMRGTRRYYNKGIDPMHVVAPGELILGYVDGRGHFPPTPQIPSTEDPGNILASPPKGLPDLWPAFATSASRSAQSRDLGRNGSFLVIRQIEQDVDAFWRYAEEQQRIHDIDADKIAAKMVGRWRNGSPLTRNPERPSDNLANDFRYAAEDPQGRNCPFGAHIRRSMPRDRSSPEGEVELSITNRHRILRAGRPYWEEEGDPRPQGLLFMCLNADIERQFEFVQQTWVNAPDFECLKSDVDPIAATVAAFAGKPPEFTIPGESGTIALRNLRPFVTLVGGGYFFVPGKRTLSYLSRKS